MSYCQTAQARACCSWTPVKPSGIGRQQQVFSTPVLVAQADLAAGPVHVGQAQVEILVVDGDLVGFFIETNGPDNQSLGI